MTNMQASTLVLKDQAGDYFLLSEEVLSSIRIPEAQKAQIEQMIAEQQDDVEGHLGYIAHAVIHLGMTVLTGVGIIYAVQSAGTEDNQVPTIDFPPSQEPVRGPGGRPA